MSNRNLILYNNIISSLDNKNLKNILQNNNKNYYFLKLLNNIGRYNFKKFLNSMEIQEYPKDKVLFYENSVAQHFYIILHGKVDIYQYQKNVWDLNEYFGNDYNKIKNYLENKFGTVFFNNFKNDLKLYNEEKNNFRIDKIITLYKGEIFGEKGLLDKKLRNATIIINNESKNSKLFVRQNRIKKFLSNRNIDIIDNNYTIIGSLTRELFAKFCQQIELKSSLKNNQYFLKYFDGYENKQEISKIINFFKKIKLQERVTLLNKNDEFTHWYILKKGQISIIDEVNPYDKLIKDNNKNNAKNLSNQKYLKNIKFVKWNISIRNIESYYFIGLFEYFENKKYYTYKYKTLKNSVLYKIELKVFL